MNGYGGDSASGSGRGSRLARLESNSTTSGTTSSTGRGKKIGNFDLSSLDGSLPSVPTARAKRNGHFDPSSSECPPKSSGRGSRISNIDVSTSGCFSEITSPASSEAQDGSGNTSGISSGSGSVNGDDTNTKFGNAINIISTGRGRLRQLMAKAAEEKVKAVTVVPDSSYEDVPPELHAQPTAAVGETRSVSSKDSSGQSRASRYDTEPIVDKGTRGRPTKVYANVVRLGFHDRKGVFQYAVSFEPEIDNVSYRRSVVWKSMPVKRGCRCYDGGATLYLPEQLPNDRTVVVTSHPADDSVKVRMTVLLTKQLKLGECTALFGTLIRNCAAELAHVRIGRKYLNPKAEHSIPQHNLKVWPGYVTAVEEKEDGVFLTLDLISRVLRADTAYTVISDIAHRTGDTLRATQELVGQVVMTRYNNKMYRVDDIDFNNNPRHVMTKADGSTISLIKYYKEQYGIDIQDHCQPLLVSRPRAKIQKSPHVSSEEKNRVILLVPELCHLTGISDTMRADMRVMKSIHEYTRLTPEQRHRGLRDFVRQLKANKEVLKMLDEWGLMLPDDPLCLDARVLDPPAIKFAGREEKANAEWQRQLHRNHINKAVDLDHWFIFCSSADKRRAGEFAGSMKSAGPGMGVYIQEPHIIAFPSERIHDIISTMRAQLSDHLAQCAVIIMRSQRADVYAAIKRLCSAQLARSVPTQCVLSSTVTRGCEKTRAIILNIALQMEAKLGAALWVVPTPLRKTMVCGIDTYHDPAGGKSCGALVCSLDEHYTQWHSQAAFQIPGVELLNSLADIFSNAFRSYHQANNDRPSRIIIFRDGVDEGSMSTVKEHEVAQLRAFCQKFAAGYSPEIIVVVALKRISTRYYAMERNNPVNSLPGTILDHTITKRNFRDFFLVSQLVRHGTVNPTHYVVLNDDCNWPVDRIQAVTYYFTHMYYNWAGTVRVPAPCLYAHKLAQLVGMHLKDVYPNMDLAGQLHYL